MEENKEIKGELSTDEGWAKRMGKPSDRVQIVIVAVIIVGILNLIVRMLIDPMFNPN